MYIWQSSLWPNFSYNKQTISEALIKLQYQKGKADAFFKLLSKTSKQLYFAESLSDEIMNSSIIENIELNYDSVFSSVVKQLDMDLSVKTKTDKNTQSVSEMIVDACSNKSPLTEERIFKWHRLLFNGLGSKFSPKKIGQYRDEPVYVLHSTPKSQEVIYEAIPASSIKEQMTRLLDFINNEKTDNPIIKSAIASFWFVSVHPFGDGNGRISRAIADYLLQGNNRDFCYCSMSSTIMSNKKAYYDILQKTQSQDSLDITQWILWFIDIYTKGLENAANVCRQKIRTSEIMHRLDPNQFNTRQLFILYKLADGSFFGKLTALKWMKLTKCQSATATRDLADLVNKNILVRLGTSSKTYHYVFNPNGLTGKSTSAIEYE